MIRARRPNRRALVLLCALCVIVSVPCWCPAQEEGRPQYRFVDGEELVYEVSYSQVGMPSWLRGTAETPESFSFTGRVSLRCLGVTNARFRLECTLELVEASGGNTGGVDLEAIARNLRERQLQIDLLVTRAGVVSFDSAEVGKQLESLPDNGGQLFFESLWKTVGLCLVLLPQEGAAHEKGVWQWKGQLLTGDEDPSHGRSWCFDYFSRSFGEKIALFGAGPLKSLSAELVNGHTVHAVVESLLYAEPGAKGERRSAEPNGIVCWRVLLVDHKTQSEEQEGVVSSVQ
jgi:hypothetical protein